MERNTNGQKGRFKSKILVIKYKLTKRSIFKTKKKNCHVIFKAYKLFIRATCKYKVSEKLSVKE